MTKNTGNGCKSQSNDENLKTISEMLRNFITDANDDEKAMLMMNIMPELMGNQTSMMKNMCQSMCVNMFEPGIQFTIKDGASSCCGETEDPIPATSEIKSLFEDWKLQVEEEINKYKKENKFATKKEIAQFLKISEESLDFFNKDVKSDESTCCCSSNCDDSNADEKTTDYELIKIQKINNVCPMCEDYASKQVNKPIVIMSCEGACLRGEVSRQAANMICHSLVPDKTVRLCLGGAFTKDGGQRNLVRNAQRVIALEGCFIKCASRMIKGVVSDVEPEIIVTDRLFSFDTNIFGINEMSEEDIKKNSLEVAKIIINRL